MDVLDSVRLPAAAQAALLNRRRGRVPPARRDASLNFEQHIH